MSMRFRYTPARLSAAGAAFFGVTSRHRPIIPITLVGPRGSGLYMGLLDTGADFVVFSEQVAVDVGIGLSTTTSTTLAGVGGTTAAVRFADVALRTADAAERREWPARVGFTAAKLRQPILGLAGCLEFFTATFHGDRHEVELAVNAAYPGT